MYLRKGVNLNSMESPKKTAGRPNKLGRQSQINVRLSEEEISLIKETAKRFNLSIADLLIAGVKLLAEKSEQP